MAIRATGRRHLLGDEFNSVETLSPAKKWSRGNNPGGVKSPE
jgi:hypothetical protein